MTRNRVWYLVSIRFTIESEYDVSLMVRARVCFDVKSG